MSRFSPQNTVVGSHQASSWWLVVPTADWKPQTDLENPSSLQDVVIYTLPADKQHLYTVYISGWDEQSRMRIAHIHSIYSLSNMPVQQVAGRVRISFSIESRPSVIIRKLHTRRWMAPEANAVAEPAAAPLRPRVQSPARAVQ
jgi:hypothetical protein